ncbi:MAG: PspC domain-containing protein [Hymenobacteraceae bacterium]|nr:PspC domain-containing protein [Hymenobacteraceae bacterium]MDX5395159.1 PspC domain-containing protein [Hymenobacteraceae bacterium]MDX5444155.1 PspC domain-containing protein [Hymenobacteraceae bacterium]MDX5511196.1 PspC domain-containing protein [Hymenobacteraceae bacterium]
MKKNISINLQGMIFHVEEDGYDLLSQYLASIKTYFATYQGHEEIIADIEARIAEKFMARLSPAKQVITRDDVQALIAQMGTVADFAAIDEEEEETVYTTTPPASESATGTTADKRLYRDEARKMISGVAAGIANYLSVDPFWIRVLFLLLFIGAPFSGGVTGVVLIIYVILWIALPVSSTLPETKVKKLYRDPDNKKVAGVASGIGLYLGVDPTIVRIIFLVLIFFGGFGILAYLLVWLMVPEAKTITEKVQMHGNPITLSSIEDSLKKNLNMKDENGQESTLAKIILLPFRLLGMLIEWLAKVMPPILTFLVLLVRIFVGALLLVISIAFITVLLTMLGISLGILHEGSAMQFGNFPAELVFSSIPATVTITGFIAALIPAVFLLILSIMLFTKRAILNATVGWSMFAIWIISLVAFGISLAFMTQNYQKYGEFTTDKVIPVQEYQTVVLDLNDDYDTDWNEVYLDIQSYPDSNNIKVTEQFSSRGRTNQEAQQNARMVTYDINKKDSLITLDGAFKYKPDAVFRKQKVEVTLYLPENKTYRISKNMADFLSYETIGKYFTHHAASYHDFRIRNSQFECLTCPAEDTTQINIYSEDAEWQGSAETVAGGLLINLNDYDGPTQTFNFEDFREIEAQGAYHIRINRADRFMVNAKGDKDDVEDVKMLIDGNTLQISHKKGFFNFNLFEKKNPVLINIEMPRLQAVDYAGAIKSDIIGFEEDEMRIEQSGAVKTFANVKSRRINIDLTGASIATLAGSSESMQADASGACQLDAEKFQTERARLDFSGACSGVVRVSKQLSADVSGASSIKYVGNPNLNIDQSGAGNVSRK